jgi:peptidoglycan LD-endopeptidase CwlK
MPLRGDEQIVALLSLECVRPDPKRTRVPGFQGTLYGRVGEVGPLSRAATGHSARTWLRQAPIRSFLTQDPIGLAGGVNLYSYAGNNPVSFSDPYGLCPPCGMLDPAGALFSFKLTTGDATNNAKVAQLDPRMRAQANLTLNASAMNGTPLRVTETYRSNETQNRYYAQGRTTPGRIITNARGGESPHNTREAMDVYPLVSGQAAVNTPASAPVWAKIGATGKAAGLHWGGDWPRFKDKPHFELPGWKDN